MKRFGFTFILLCFLAPIAAQAATCCKCIKPTNLTVTCLTDPAASCTDIIVKNNANAAALSGFTCQPVTDAECKPVASGGSALCISGPTAASAYTAPPPAPKELVTLITAPTLNIPIPGLNFTTNIPVYSDSPMAEIPFLAQYLTAIYNYFFGIVIITAAVMIVYGGFKYILSSTVGGIKNGKEVITDAIIGLLLAFGTYTILATINPATTLFTTLTLKVVRSEKEKMDIQKGIDVANNNSKNELTADDEAPGPPPPIPAASSCKSQKIPQEYRDAAMQVQLATGVPGAALLANWAVESGFGTSCFGPPGKKFNCFGVVAAPFEEHKGTSCDGVTCANGGWPAMNCAPKCSPGQPPSCYCWKIFDSPEPTGAFTKTASLMKKGSWQKYAGKPDSFLKNLFNYNWAGPDYGVWRTYAQVMRDQCLVPAGFNAPLNK